MVGNPLTSKPGAVVIDANTAIAIASKEVTEPQAKAALAYYLSNGYISFAPGVIISETLFALCGQEERQVLSASQYTQAIADFQVFMQGVLPPPSGEASLILRAAAIRESYGCSRSADAIYIALAEELSPTYTTRLLTFDRGLPNQAARHAPSVTVHLLT